MARTFQGSLCAIALGFGLLVSSGTALAASNLSTNSPATTTAEEQHEQSWYREQTGKPDPKLIVQQKAAIRADQRMSRMASMQWYGMSNSRPQASSTPFSTRYSPLWEMPGGKPSSWYPYSRPGYVMYWR